MCLVLSLNKYIAFGYIGYCGLEEPISFLKNKIISLLKFIEIGAVG